MDGRESYLDNVPFCIGPKYCPPRDIPLPLAIHYELPEDILSLEYDFEKEHQVLKLAEESGQNGVPNHEQKAASESIANTLPINHGNTAWNPDTILQPRSPLQNTEGKGSSTLLEDNRKINLSDFENCTPSPFDYVELQTINDLEELNTVFQGLCTNIDNNPIDSFNHEQCSENNTAEIENPTEDRSHNTISSKNVFSNSLYRSGENYLSYSYPDISNPLDSSSKTFSHDGKQRHSVAADDFSFTNPSFQDVPCGSSSITDQSHKESECKDSSVTCSPLRCSKSVSDLSKLTSKQSSLDLLERSQTPPITPPDDDPSCMLNNKISLAKFQPSNGLVTCNTVQTVQNMGLPDPYDELNESERRVVDTIRSMGFHQGQVARTVKHLGTDEKKVVEHLCQIQMLEESGYDKLEAEAALHLHNYDKREAVRFLDLLCQFQDLGFEKEAIKKALVQNKNDRDKVIDALLL